MLPFPPHPSLYPAHAPPASEAPRHAPLRQWLHCWIAVLAVLAVTACASAPPRGYEEDRFTDADARRRHQQFLDLVLERPQQLDQQLQQASLESYRQSQEAWWAVERRIEAARQRRTEGRSIDSAAFFALTRRAEEQQRQQRADRRQAWTQFVQRQGGATQQQPQAQSQTPVRQRRDTGRVHFPTSGAPSTAAPAR